MDEKTAGWGRIYKNSVLSDPTVDRGVRLLYAQICSYADVNGICYPSIERLAKEHGASARTIQRYLCVLESRGALARKYRLGQASLICVLE